MFLNLNVGHPLVYGFVANLITNLLKKIKSLRWKEADLLRKYGEAHSLWVTRYIHLKKITAVIGKRLQLFFSNHCTNIFFQGIYTVALKIERPPYKITLIRFHLKTKLAIDLLFSAACFPSSLVYVYKISTQNSLLFSFCQKNSKKRTIFEHSRN